MKRKLFLLLLILPVFPLGCTIHVNARSGNLTMRGQEGLTDVRIEGRACASDTDLLDQIGLEASQSGSSVRVDGAFSCPAADLHVQEGPGRQAGARGFAH